MTAFAHDRQERGRIAELEATNQKLWDFVGWVSALSLRDCYVAIDEARLMMESKPALKEPEGG